MSQGPDNSEGEGRGREETLHEMLDDTRFGAIAVWGGFVSREALEETLAEQSAARASGKTAARTGEMLVEKGLLTGEEVGRILRVQLQRLPAEGHLVFGRIAEAHRFITPEENRRALDVQSREILAPRRVRTLADILMDMGAIDREAADAVVSFQAKGDSTRMSKASRARLEGGPPGGPPGGLEEGQLPAAAPGNGGTPLRPVFLPRGALGFVSDHSTWLVIAAAALLAVVLIAFRERIFGARVIRSSRNDVRLLPPRRQGRQERPRRTAFTGERQDVCRVPLPNAPVVCRGRPWRSWRLGGEGRVP